MRKLIFPLAIFALIVVACQDNSEEITPNQEVATIDMSDFFVYTNDSDIASKSTTESKPEKCFTMKVLNEKLKENPGLYQKMYDIELHTRTLIAGKGKPGGGTGGGGGSGGGGGVVPPTITPFGDFPSNTIPVIFHVIYNSADENISTDRLNEQIVALNQDFGTGNGYTPSGYEHFLDFKAEIGVKFATAGVVRVENKKKRSWRPDDTMKYSSQGGSDVIDPEHYLNIWVVNSMPYMGGYILGYAQFPGGDWATDGIVLEHRFVGNTSYSTGRTATHEIGHWMNLRHIWGDGGCGVDDFVADTPVSDRYNSDCPTYPTTHCDTPDMTMNFMDYSNDNCMSMFTLGQKTRMSATFSSGFFREQMGITIQ